MIVSQIEAIIYEHLANERIRKDSVPLEILELQIQKDIARNHPVIMKLIELGGEMLKLVRHAISGLRVLQFAKSESSTTGL